MNAITRNEVASPLVRMRATMLWAAVTVAVALILGSTLLGVSPAHAAAASTTMDGITYSYDDTGVPATATITAYDSGTSSLGVTPSIPATVTIGAHTYSITAIADNAFKDQNLTSVVIPNSVTTIGAFAFGGNSLVTVTIPDSVTSLGNFSFGSNDLTSVSLSNSVTSLGSNVFSNNDLTSVVIPNSVTFIDTSAFYHNKLTAVTIPDSVTTIGVDAFASNLLTSVVIPSSVNDIENLAFDENPSLTDVVFLGPAPTTFTAASGANGSLGPPPGPLVHYPNNFAAPPAGGYTSPTWQGYNSQRNPIVSFDLGGHGTAIAPEDVGFGLPVAAPASPAATGWTFTGWFTDAAHTNPVVFSNAIAKDTTLYAGWKSDQMLAETGSTTPILPLTLLGALTLLVGILLQRKAGHVNR